MCFLILHQTWMYLTCIGPFLEIFVCVVYQVQQSCHSFICSFFSFSKGKRSNLRRSSVQLTLNSISELVDTHAPSNSTDSVAEEPVRRTRRNKTTAASDVDGMPVKRSTRNKTAAKAKEQTERAEDELTAPQSPDNALKEQEHTVEESSSSSSSVPTLVSEVLVKIPTVERISAEKLLQCSPSPGRSAQKITITVAGGQASTRSSARHSLVMRRSLAGLRHSMTQEAVRRASRRSFLKKKARLGNSTCSSTISGEITQKIMHTLMGVKVIFK